MSSLTQMFLKSCLRPKLCYPCVQRSCSSIKYPPEVQKFRKKIQNNEDGIFDKTIRIFKDDLNRMSKGDFSVPEPKVPKEIDFLIIGGGIIGSSIAYWLKTRARDSVTVMVAERDLKYTRSSSVLSVGGIRQQFSLPENIALSVFSSDFMRNIKQHLSVLDDDPPDIQFQPHGYLFLATEAGVEQMMENNYVQKEYGGKVELLEPPQLKSRFPWLNLDGIAMGSYGYENEGWFDPWSLLSAFKKKALSLGANFVNGEIVAFELEEIPKSKLFSSAQPDLDAHFAYLKDPVGEIHQIEFAKCIIAAGAFSGEVAKMLRIGERGGLLQVPMPVEPRKRYVYTFHCDKGPGLDMPLVIDPSGAYVRREGLGGMYIGGCSPVEAEEPDISNLDVDYNFFDKTVWPLIANRIPAFEAIKVSSAWAGYYDYNTLDQNAFIGNHPFYNDIFFATGFSGHGIQMAPAIGRAVSEILIDQEYKTLDLTRFGLERLFAQKPLFESNIV